MASQHSKSPVGPGPADAVRAEFFQTGDSSRVLAWRTAYIDSQVLQACHEHLASAPGLALLAVGGYGRRQLFPHSDVDLLLLFDTEKAVQNSKTTLAPFLRNLWDRGMRVSQSVRTVAECTELHDANAELNVSLLDTRFLAGDPQLAGKLTERLPRFVHSQRQPLIRNLARLTRERHLKHGDTYYHLEPNCKEAPGGLRDYQVFCWLRQIAGAEPARLGTVEESPELTAARQFLFTTRCYLHYHYDRDANALSFDDQEWIAELAGGRDPAGWMRDYFRHARVTHRSASRALEESEARSSSLFSQFRDWRSRLSNAEFSVVRERVHFKVPKQLDLDPMLALRLFTFVARHGIRPSPDAEQRVREAGPFLRESLRRPQSLWPAIRELLSLPYADQALRAMHGAGLLTAVFPEIEEIECLVIRDFFHRYTVDEHTLLAIQTVIDLDRPILDAWRKQFAELYAELEQPAVLLFALLFHDAGKGSPDEGHVEASVRVAEHAMERIGMPEHDRQLVRLLISRHLDMSATMSGRDLEEAATIETLAHRVETVECAKALTLLTYADISAVNPGAMTAWRAGQLFRLYRLTYNELTRELDSERIVQHAVDSAQQAAFLEGFPTRYLRTHTAEEIQAHCQMTAELEEKGVAIHLVKVESASKLTLLTTDRPFLFASIAGTLSSFGMNILKAEAFANRRGEVLDTFVFSDPLRTLELNPSESERLAATLEKVVLAKVEVQQLLRNRPKVEAPSRGARFEPTVAFDSDVSPNATLIQISAQDRPGLLYDLARTLSTEGCSIEVVLIDTEAHRAIDVFYVTSQGSKLSAGMQARLTAQLLAVCGEG